MSLSLNLSFVVKIPGLEMEVKWIPMGMGWAVALLLVQANVSIIFTGGVGKNGSTVAVRLLQCQPVVNSRDCTFDESWFDPNHHNPSTFVRHYACKSELPYAVASNPAWRCLTDRKNRQLDGAVSLLKLVMRTTNLTILAVVATVRLC